jgi:hypothetical protein
MDPFTAHYTQKGQLDYKIEKDEEGFVVENFAGDLYKGKFFKDPNLVPKWESK